MEKLTIMDGLSSMHDWMKTQTKLDPKVRRPKKVERQPSSEDVSEFVTEEENNHEHGFQEDDTEVVIELDAKNPQAVQGLIRFNFSTGAFKPVRFV